MATGDATEPPTSSIVRVSRADAPRGPLRVNLFAVDGRPLCSVALDVHAVLGDDRAATSSTLRASPSFRGAPPCDVLFDLRPVW